MVKLLVEKDGNYDKYVDFLNTFFSSVSAQKYKLSEIQKMNSIICAWLLDWKIVLDKKLK